MGNTSIYLAGFFLYFVNDSGKILVGRSESEGQCLLKTFSLTEENDRFFEKEYQTSFCFDMIPENDVLDEDLLFSNMVMREET